MSLLEPWHDNYKLVNWKLYCSSKIFWVSREENNCKQQLQHQQQQQQQQQKSRPKKKKSTPVIFVLVVALIYLQDWPWDKKLVNGRFLTRDA